MHPALGQALVIRGDARALPLPDNTVDVVVTSPPYFALRSYTDDDGTHYAGQIGDEPTPAEFLDALISVTRECVRVLKPAGSLFVNLGDKYAERGGPEREGGIDGDLINHAAARPRRRSAREAGVREKSLMMLPARYAIRCTDELRLILRAEMIWDKPNGLPESVKDRVRRAHEQWFHLVQRPRYFSAVDHVREPHVDPTGLTWEERAAGGEPGRQGEQRGSFGDGMAGSPLGRLPGSVRRVPTEPLDIPAWLGTDHFAAFPTAWPRFLIDGWCPRGICLACGQGRWPVTEVTQTKTRAAGSTGRPKQQTLTQHHDGGRNGVGYPQTRSTAQVTGYRCACEAPDAPTRPAVVLDPFGGTGTTALVAKALGHVGVTVDRSAAYCRVAAWRVSDRNQLAKVLGVPKLPSHRIPPREQGSLLDLIGEAP